MNTTGSPFGEKLRAWRRRRGLSQLDLSIAAETTPRHLSFLETGRSRPGTDLVLRVAEALQLSLREKNDLLTAAGLAPIFAQRSLDDDALQPVRAIIKRVLKNHDPYPAFVFGPGLQLIQTNASGELLFPGMLQLSPEQLIEAWCSPASDPDPEQAKRNAYQVVSTLRRELTNHPHPRIPALLNRAEELAKALGEAPEFKLEEEDSLAMCSKLKIQDREIRTVATVMRFDKPTDVTVADLRIELIFPADDQSDEFLMELVNSLAKS